MDVIKTFFFRLVKLLCVHRCQMKWVTTIAEVDDALMTEWPLQAAKGNKFLYYLHSEISKRYEMGDLYAMDEIGVMCDNYC